MELLRDLRAETQRAEATTAAGAAKRQKAMQARLEKVRQRKRLKMGLPMKGEDCRSHIASVVQNFSLLPSLRFTPVRMWYHHGLIYSG